MKYCQLDKITELQPGKKITALRTLRADEEYLADHFPRFPVMPGVMMLEALHQAAVWLVRRREDFVGPLVVLREVRNVKFGDFLAPDETLEVTAEAIKQDGNLTTIKATASKAGRVTVSARLIVEERSSGDPERIGTDADVRTRIERQFKELFNDTAAPA